ncbi:hypothetical protein, partial [Paenibacillus alvei]|uniref:hypothetical protein n=2 Tax=Paenibacillus alvei TaxID=44250 RepID=UPI0028C39FD5
LKKGDMVVMHTCVEARNPKNYGKVWRCKTDQFSRGTGVYEQHSVFLEGFTGSFAAEYLQKVDIPDQSEEVERLKEELRKTNITLSTVQGADEIHAKAMDFNLDMVKLLQTQLQDALNTLQWYVDSSWSEYVVDASKMAKEAIQRIQRGE